MSPVDEQDTVVELKSVPQSDMGAPLPFVIATDHHLILEYYVSASDPSWDGLCVNIASSNTVSMVAVVRFYHPYAHFFGPPNDEAFSGHPLASRGLKPYSVFEIQQSSWIRQFEQMHSAHPYHRHNRFMESKHHFVFAFHDNIFKCIGNCNVLSPSTQFIELPRSGGDRS